MKRVITDKGAVDIRPAERNDLDYIISSWLRTWEKSPEMSLPGMVRDLYFKNAHELLDTIIPTSSAQGALYVAHATGSPHIIRGFLCGEVTQAPEIAYLHWVQVKKQEWDQGVATALMDTFIEDFGIEKDQNILYTFTSRAIRQRELMRKAQERYNLVAWPFKKWEGWVG